MSSAPCLSCRSWKYLLSSSPSWYMSDQLLCKTCCQPVVFNKPLCDCNILNQSWEEQRKKKSVNSFFFFFFCECFAFFSLLPLCTVTFICVSFVSHVLSITCMLLCIYAIVAVVTMMVCEFRPDFTKQSVMQRTGKIWKIIKGKSFWMSKLNHFLSDFLQFEFVSQLELSRNVS